MILHTTHRSPPTIHAGNKKGLPGFWQTSSRGNGKMLLSRLNEFTVRADRGHESCVLSEVHVTQLNIQPIF